SYAIGGIQVKFPFQTDELCLTAFPSTEERREKMERILEPYRNRFLRIDLQLEPDSNLCRTFLDKIDFFQLKAALLPALRAEIEAIACRGKPEPLYAFVLGVSPAHESVAVFWNTAKSWSAREEYYASTGHTSHPSTKYNGPDFRCEPLTQTQAVWEPVWEVLGNYDQICGEFYKLTGGGGLFYQNYENRFRATAVHALREVASEFSRIARTDDFVFYVQDYVGNGDDLFLMLETVSEERLRKLMPWLFPTRANIAE
ncbi:MAG: DUF4303 domain-containing protein, partial [Verrucomicrobiaceae bacterium]